MIARLFAQTRFTWKLYHSADSALTKRKRRETPPDSVGGMHDIFPDGDGWAWRKDRWVIPRVQDHCLDEERAHRAA